jgi:DNA adenine methylase
VTPLLKWAGGKARIVSQIRPWLPLEYGTYHEPFLGGGAMFFALAPTSARLNDLNGRLITCYRRVRDDVEGVLAALKDLAKDTSRSAYYAARDRFNRLTEPPLMRQLADDPPPDETETAALLLYLNRLCFNGLYRENAAGKFNVSFGRFKRPRVVFESRLRKASEALQDACLTAGDYTEALRRAAPGDFVYLDPPYDPVSATADFTGYCAAGFGPGDHRRLANACRELDARGVRFLVSNADTPQVRHNYIDNLVDTDFRVIPIRTPGRSLNRDGTKRAQHCREVLILN